jgi:hypothetical protein
MLPISTILSHSLLYGAVLSALLSAFIVATLLFRPMIWINDAPPDLRAAAGPMSAADHRFQRVSGAVFILLLVALAVMNLVGLRALAGGALTFWQAALAVFVVVMTFNTVDLLLLDWLLVERLLAERIVLPNAPGVRFTTGDAYHLRGFLIGTGLSLVAAVVIGGVVALVW